MGGPLQAVIARHHHQPPRRRIRPDQLLDQAVGVVITGGKTHRQTTMFQHPRHSGRRVPGVEHHSRLRDFFGRERFGQKMSNACRDRSSPLGPAPRPRMPTALSTL